ncbi:MAG: hypothetical protein ACK5PB_07250 [Pirellula sp.]
MSWVNAAHFKYLWEELEFRKTCHCQGCYDKTGADGNGKVSEKDSVEAAGKELPLQRGTTV